MYQWIVLVHIVGAFLFVMAHGAAVWSAVQIRRERDPRRITALLDLSGMSLTALYVGLLVLLVGGIWAAIYQDWFRFLWPWAALIVLVAVVILMYVVATPFFKGLRIAIGQRTMGLPKDAPDPTPLPDAEIVALAARTPVNQLALIGFGGLLIILWLMVLKPF